MKTFSNRTVVLAAIAIVVAVALVAGAYTIGARQGQPAAGTIVQVARPAGAAEAAAAPTGWDTEWSQKLGVTLLEEFDSGGLPVWNPKDHPLVFITTEGPGYANQLSGAVTTPGVAIIDANTREVVASRHYDLGYEGYFEPHGLGVSLDGRWIYLPTGSSAGFGDVGSGRLLIIDAQTLNLQMVLATPTNPHHAKAFTNAQGQQLVLAYGFREGNFYVLDPNDNNRVVGGVANADLKARGYLAFVNPSGKYMFISIRPPSGMEVHGGVAIVDTETWEVVRGIETGGSPIWAEFSADGKYAYVSNGHDSTVSKIDISSEDVAAWEVVGEARAGTEGPYGLRLSWDEKQLWTVGKGEGSHNLGITMGLVNPETMGRPVGEFYTGCARADHATLHPDPSLNQIWVTCNASFETIVFDMEKKEVTARIPMPSGGSTHSGSFVRYNPDFSGEVLSDQNGLHGSALEQKRTLITATASK